jgi:sarcosine oxidase
MTDSYDVIVLGLGAMGSSTAYELSRRGLRVLGLDRYPPGHTHGSSHGDSRIIRELYYEGTLYVPLLQRAYTLWQELEQASGASLLRITGGVMLGAADAHVVRGSRQTAKQLGLAYEDLTAAELRKRFPAMDPPDHFEGVWDARGGYLRPEAAIAAYLELASRHGARFEIGEPSATWAADGEGVTVTAGTRRYRADQLVVAAGSWITRQVPELRLPTPIERQVLVWFDPPGAPSNSPAGTPDAFAPDRCPVFICEYRPGHSVYGFPRLTTGVKASIFHDGETVSDPDVCRRPADAAETARLQEYLGTFMPALRGAPVRATITCVFTNTSDGRFIIDRHPAHPQVIVCSPCSGHGFKFASAVGEANADLVTGTRPRTDLSPFALGRFLAPATGRDVVRPAGVPAQQPS